MVIEELDHVRMYGRIRYDDRLCVVERFRQIIRIREPDVHGCNLPTTAQTAIKATITAQLFKSEASTYAYRLLVKTMVSMAGRPRTMQLALPASQAVEPSSRHEFVPSRGRPISCNFPVTLAMYACGSTPLTLEVWMTVVDSRGALAARLRTGE